MRVEGIMKSSKETSLSHISSDKFKLQCQIKSSVFSFSVIKKCGLTRNYHHNKGFKIIMENSKKTSLNHTSSDKFKPQCQITSTVFPFSVINKSRGLN